MARAYLKLDQPEQAKLACQEALQLNDRFIDAHRQMGEVLLALEDYEGAVRAYRVRLCTMVLRRRRSSQLSLFSSLSFFLQQALDLSGGDDHQIRQELQKAETALKQSKVKRFPSVL